MDSATLLTLGIGIYATGTIAWAHTTRSWMEHGRQATIELMAAEAKKHPRAVTIGLHIGAFIWTLGWPVIAPAIALTVAVHLARRS